VGNRTVNDIDPLGLYAYYYRGMWDLPLDNEMFDWFLDGSGKDFRIKSERVNPTSFHLNRFAGSAPLIKEACKCKKANVKLTDKFTTGFKMLGRVAFDINGVVQSADGKTWTFEGTIKPVDEQFDFFPLWSLDRDWDANTANVAGGLYALFSTAHTFPVKFEGSVPHPHSGKCR
jgi:hypothetical protein